MTKALPANILQQQKNHFASFLYQLTKQTHRDKNNHVNYRKHLGDLQSLLNNRIAVLHQLKFSSPSTKFAI